MYFAKDNHQFCTAYIVYTVDPGEKKKGKVYNDYKLNLYSCRQTQTDRCMHFNNALHTMHK